MVFLSCNFWAKTTRKFLKTGFRDSLKVHVKGGSGGNGFPKFGGVGGKGGDVIVKAKEGISLQDVFKKNKTKVYAAKNGKHSTHNFILGPPGENTIFEVPVGVTIVTAEKRKKLGELNEENQELVVAKGGVGGHSKNGFLGVKGQSYPIIFDLKLIADIGLVGFPNAGKSTLLKGISHAKPKIASYPFTTVKPNVGIVSYPDFRRISVADLPGLIEGAYANKGMGHQFLKHVERTKMILMIVDINGFRLSPMYPHRNCLDTIMLLNKELEMYNEDLLDKPALLLINKMDCEEAKEKLEEVKEDLKDLQKASLKYPDEMRPKSIIKFFDVMAISAKENANDIEKVKNKLRRLLDVLDEMEDKEKQKENSELLENATRALKERGPRLV